MISELAPTSGNAVPAPDRRAEPRVPADFYAVELRGSSRYFRLVRNVSRTGLLFENRIADEKPGEMVELELPRRGAEPPVRVRAEVVRVSVDGTIGVRLLDAADPDSLGGKLGL